MARRGQKRRAPRDYVIALILLLVALWLTSLLIGIVDKEERARRAATEARAKLALLSEREATLRKNLEELGTERGQDASIRETYGVARPGEEVIIVLQGEPTKVEVETLWWERLFGWLK